MQSAPAATETAPTPETALPAGVAEVIDAALASGDAAAVETVVRFARQAHPQAAEAIDQRVALWRSRSAPAALAQQKAKAPQAATKATASTEETDEVTGNAVKWSGEGEAGAFTSSGNAPGLGFAGSIKLLAEGEDWRIRAAGRIDYQETANIVTRNQYRLSAEPNYKFSRRAYLFGLGQYEKDRFQGFVSRTSLSGGLGYTVLARKGAKFNVKAGPAWRRTVGTDGISESIIAGLASFDLKLKLTQSLDYSQEASVYTDSRGSTFYTLAAIDSRLIGRLKARLSYLLQHETAPEPGRNGTDATSRLTLVYGF